MYSFFCLFFFGSYVGASAVSKRIELHLASVFFFFEAVGSPFFDAVHL